MTGESVVARFESLSVGWGDWMFQMSWQVALLVFILALVTRLFRQRSAVWLHALWLLVLIRLVLPPDFSIPTGWGWWLLPPRSADVALANVQEATQSSPSTSPGETTTVPDPVQKDHGALPEEPPARDVSDESRSVGAARVARQSPNRDADPASATSESARLPGPARWIVGLMLAWMGVAGTLLALLGIGTVRIWKWVYDAEPIDDADLYRLLEGCRRQLGIVRLIELRNSDSCTTPVVVGYSRPVILLPRAVLQRLNHDELRAVLLHELNHVVRGDALVNLLQGILGAVYFFHPLVWWANARLRELREEACDELTVAALDGRRKTYGEAIVKVTEIFGYASPPLALGVLESKTPARRRLSRILDPQLPIGRRLYWNEIGMILALGLIVLPSAGAWTSGADAQTQLISAMDPATAVKSPVKSEETTSKVESTAATSPEETQTPEDNQRADERSVIPLPHLRYGWQTDRTTSYVIRIEVDLGNDSETLSGTSSLRVRWADSDRAELVYSGMLSSDRPPRRGAPFPPSPPRPVFPAFGGGGGGSVPAEHVLEVDHYGKLRDIRGESQLPYLLGNVSQLLIVTLPNPSAKTWEEKGTSTVTVFPPDDRGPWPRFGPFARRATSEQWKARESSHYSRETSAESNRIHRDYELRTDDEVAGAPRLQVTGSFHIQFDFERGVPATIDGKLLHIQNSAHATTRIPIVFSAKLLPEQPPAATPTIAATNGPGFGAANPTPPNPPRSREALDPDAQEKLLQTLSGIDVEKARAAAETLSNSLPGERPREVARALAGWLTHSDEAMRAAAARALSDWATIAEAPALIAALKDESPRVIHGAIDALRRLRDPQAIPALVELIQARRERSNAGRALRSIGRPAESAVSQLLDESDWSIRLEACRILQSIGTDRSIDTLDQMAENDSNILVRRAAAQAAQRIRDPGSIEADPEADE